MLLNNIASFSQKKTFNLAVLYTQIKPLLHGLVKIFKFPSVVKLCPEKDI